jgi:hypothetical protein
MTSNEQVLSTVCSVVDAGPVTVCTTEQDIRSANGKLVKRIKKHYSGPKGPVDRLQWKPFGSVLKKKPTRATIDSDVQMEFLNNSRAVEAEWIPNSIYVKHAQEEGWSSEEITSIIQYVEHGVLRPDKKYIQLFESKLRTLIAEAKIATIGNSINHMPIEQDVLNVKQSLRLRFKQKTYSRQQQQSDPDTPKSLASRLEDRRAERDESQQKSTLFIENVPEEYEEADIKEHLQDYDIRRINIVRRDNMRGVKESVGKAFIECDTEDVAIRCLEYLKTCRWENSVISAQLSKPKPVNDPTAAKVQYMKKKPMPRYKITSRR